MLPAGKIGSVLVFLFGVIGVDAGRASNHPSIQGQNLAQELSLAVTMQCVVQAPMSRLLRAPYVDSPRVPLRCLPGYPPGVDLAWSMQDEVLGGITDYLPMVMSDGGLLTGPLYEEGWRVPLGWYCSSVTHHKHTHLLG